MDRYLERVEAVLGSDWTTHIEGQHLKTDGDSFRSKLNPTPLFEDWKKKVLEGEGLRGVAKDLVL